MVMEKKEHAYHITGCIVTYNNKRTIMRAIASLLEHTQGVSFVLHVVDNASTDGTPELICKHFPQVILHKKNKNPGFGTGHNQVLPLLDSKYHIIINPDVVLRSDVITQMASYMDAHEDIGLLSPKICFPEDGRPQILGKRNPTLRYLIASRLRKEGSPSPTLAEYAMLNADESDVFDIENATGCFMMLPTQLFKQLGGFDEKFFMYFEDCDLTRRVCESHRAVFYPHATVFHEWGRESKKNGKLMLIQIRSMLYYFYKWRKCK